MWDFTARSVRTVGDPLSVAAGSLLNALLRVFPDGVLIALRERLALRRPLDYRRASVWLRVTSQFERRVRLRSCEKEPETVAWIEDTFHAGDVLYDVGANVGAYALIAAKHTEPSATVYAFEPGHRTFANLVENITLNGLDGRILPFQVALGDRTGLVTFNYSTVEAGAARHPGMRQTAGAASAASQVVLGYRLDAFAREFGLRPATHLKIDVDGGELAVLHGAGDFLRSPALRTVLVEADTTSSQPKEIGEVLREAGFRIAASTLHGSEVLNLIYVR